MFSSSLSDIRQTFDVSYRCYKVSGKKKKKKRKVLNEKLPRLRAVLFSGETINKQRHMRKYKETLTDGPASVYSLNVNIRVSLLDVV